MSLYGTLIVLRIGPYFNKKLTSVQYNPGLTCTHKLQEHHE